VTTADPDRAKLPIRISNSQHANTVIASASEAIHRAARKKRMDCFVAVAPRNDDGVVIARLAAFAKKLRRPKTASPSKPLA
jgi:hypothetical protein